MDFQNWYELRKIKNSSSERSNLNFSQKNPLWCTIWDDVRTYLTRDINPKDKTALIVAINYFKQKEKGKQSNY